MQTKTIVAASLLATVAVASNATTNGTNSNGTHTPTSPEHANSASGMIVNAGIVGAFVAGGVALLL